MVEKKRERKMVRGQRYLGGRKRIWSVDESSGALYTLISGNTELHCLNTAKRPVLIFRLASDFA